MTYHKQPKLRNLSHNVLSVLFPIAQQIITRRAIGITDEESVNRGLNATLGKSVHDHGDHTGPELRVALVVGHNVARQGAICTGELPSSEFLFNTAVAQGIAFLAWKELQVNTFFRKAGMHYSEEIAECYLRVNSWQPDLTIEMHFNATDGKADYSLAMFKDDHSQLAAQHLVDASHEVLRTGGKRVHQFQSKRERGASGAEHCRGTWVLLEPFFGDHAPTMQRINSASGYQLVIDAYLEGIQRFATTLVDG